MDPHGAGEGDGRQGEVGEHLSDGVTLNEGVTCDRLGLMNEVDLTEVDFKCALHV